MCFYYTWCQVPICGLATGPRYDFLPYLMLPSCCVGSLSTLVECCTAKLVVPEHTPRHHCKILCPSWFFMGSTQAGWTWIGISVIHAGWCLQESKKMSVCTTVCKVTQAYFTFYSHCANQGEM